MKQKVTKLQVSSITMASLSEIGPCFARSAIPRKFSLVGSAPTAMRAIAPVARRNANEWLALGSARRAAVRRRLMLRASASSTTCGPNTLSRQCGNCCALVIQVNFRRLG